MNIDILSLNLKSKSKYTTPRAPIKTNLIIEKKPKLYSTPNSAKRSRFVPPIAIPISDLDGFEEKSDRKSSHVKFLTEQRDYSTPRSIQTFVLYRNGDLQYTESAVKIQKCWKAYLNRKRFRIFMNFIHYMKRKTLRFALHMWILSLKKPANISKNSYYQVTSYMISHGYIIKDEQSKKLITKDEYYNVNDFNQAMNTDFLFLQPRYPPKIIKRYQFNFYRPFIHNIFTSWLTIVTEKLALIKSSRPMQELARRRSLYGPMFWTFYFWRRWSKFKKTKQIQKTKGQLFVMEWSIYIGKKKHKIKLNKAADKLHNRFIKSTIVTQLRIKSANHSIYNKALESYQKRHEESIMLLTLRGFNIMIANKQFNQNIKRRVIRSWYKVIDLQILGRMKKSVLRYRSFLKCLKSTFKKWHNYVIDEGIRRVYLHSVITQNNLLMMKTFFLLKSDFPHFAFVAAFYEWKKLLILNHNKRKFINWSLTKAKPKVTLLSLFNILKENAAIRLNHENFNPFVSKSGDKFNQSNKNDLFESNKNSASAKKAKRKKLIKAMKRESDGFPPVKVYTTSVNQTLSVYKNLNDFDMCDVNWHKKISSDEVKTLFYRIIIVLSKKSPNRFKTPKEKIEILDKFRSDNLLYNIHEIHGYKGHQDRQDIQRQLSLNKILKRDFSLFMAFDTHAAAISLHKVSNKFEINQAPIEDVTSLKPRKKKTTSKKNLTENAHQNVHQNQNENDNKNKIKKNQKDFIYQQRQSTPGRVQKEINPDHPLLRPIENVKKSIDINNRKYRRSPEEIFDVKESSSTIHNLKLINKLSSTASQAKFQLDSNYENFSPLRQSLKATRMMSSREFLLKELSEMHDTATSQLEKINEGDEYGIFSKEDLDKINDDDLFEKQVVLPRFDEIPTIYKTPIKSSILSDKFKNAFKNKNNENSQNSSSSSSSDSINEQEKIDEINNNDDNDITIADLSKNFINDPGYFEYSDAERAAMLSNKYLRVLEVLIDDSLTKPTPPNIDNNNNNDDNESQKNESVESENDQIKNRISSIIRKFSPNNNKKKGKDAKTTAPKPSIINNTTNSNNVKGKGKQKKKVLFADPDQQFETIVAPDGSKYMKSNCPEFNNVAFSGTTVLTNKPWETEIEKSSQSSSSEKKLKKKRKKRKKKKRRNSDLYSSNSSDEEYYNDDSEFNTASLPKPIFKVPGFDDNEVSSPSSNSNSTASSGLLFDQINSFLSSSCSNVDDQEHLIERLRQEASSTLNNSDEMRRTFLRLIDAVAHQYVLRQLDNSFSSSSQMQFSSLVDIEGLSSRETTTEDEESSRSIAKQNKVIKNSFYNTKKFSAFDTDSRLVEPPDIIERKFTFTKDLLAAIAENAKFASTLKMKIYKDVSKMKPFEGMKMLAKRVRDKIKSVNQTHVIKSSASYDKNNNEICLSIGKVENKKEKSNFNQKRPQTAKSKMKNNNSNKMKMIKNLSKNDNKNLVKLEVTSRTRTPLIDGCIKPEPGNKKIVKRPVLMKRKPQFTKMSPSTPLQPPEFHIAKEFNDDFDEGYDTVKQEQSKKSPMLSGPPAKLKWSLPSDRIKITDDDIDFFVFVTPYIMPPEILNSILERQEKHQNQTI